MERANEFEVIAESVLLKEAEASRKAVSIVNVNGCNNGTIRSGLVRR